MLCDPSDYMETRLKKSTVGTAQISQGIRSRISCYTSQMDDNAKGGLTQFWDFLTMIPCALKHFKFQIK